MSGILVRCPNCGTTQGTVGECEACHEATTRWFCPNHEPGLWLDAALCPTCGARPGVPGTRPRPTPTRPRPTTPPRATPAPPPRRAPTREETYASDMPADEPEVWSGSVRSSRDPRARDPRFGDAPEVWRIDPSAILPTAVRVVSVFGCLRRLVMIAILLLVLAVLAFYWLFGVGGVLVGSRESVSEPSYAESIVVFREPPAGTEYLLRWSYPVLAVAVVSGS